MRIGESVALLCAVLLLFGVPSGAALEDAASANEPMTTEAELLRELERAVEKGGYDEALVMLKEKVAKQPLNIPARFFLATALQSRGDNSACIREVRVGERLKAADDRLLGILWVCLYEDGRKPEALETAAQAVLQFPGSGESHRWYGISLLDENNGPEASLHFQKAITIDPQDATALYLLAQLYRSRGYIVPSFLTYLRFFSVEPEGNRADKARAQLRELLNVNLLIQPEDKSRVEMRLSVGPDGPTDEGDYSKAQQRIAVYAAPNNREPSLNPSKLEKVLHEVLKALPEAESTAKGSFILEITAPFLEAAEVAGFSKGLADLVLMEDKPSPEAIAFLKWSSGYAWNKR
ncbi:MAG: tetratricopeptide repeat protein [Acidobacteria bacterium]|nr:tetratricopeptide repeat protein [Acidobacteriota bacterium]